MYLMERYGVVFEGPTRTTLKKFSLIIRSCWLMIFWKKFLILVFLLCVIGQLMLAAMLGWNAFELIVFWRRKIQFFLSLNHPFGEITRPSTFLVLITLSGKTQKTI
uniref:Putative ovule protein n=2 Tax=Solanum chacoense TaxID=4108 RepID=A0A0V0I3A8_SOLCH